MTGTMMPYRKRSVKVAMQTVETMKRLDDLCLRYRGGVEASRLFQDRISRTAADIVKKIDGVQERRERHERICTPTIRSSEPGHYQDFEHIYGGKRRARDESFP